jgi:hypothetical protein
MSHEAAKLMQEKRSQSRRFRAKVFPETGHGLTTYSNTVEDDSKIELFKIREFHKHIATKGNVVERGGSFA